MQLHTYQGQELEELKEGPEVQLQAWLLLHTNKVKKQINDNVCELQNGCHFTFTIRSHTGLSLGAHANQKHTGEFWEM